MSDKYNKRFFTCKDDLMSEFDKEVEDDKRFQNRSEALRYLIRRYIEERQNLKNAKK